MGVSSLSKGLIRPVFRIDRNKIDARVGIQCALAIAVPLALGLLTGHTLAGAWGAIGAFLADFSTFQPGYRVRARVVVVAALVIATGTFLGAVTGIGDPAVFPLIAGWAFIAGMLVALGPSAAMVGVVSSVGLAVATALNATPLVALEDAAAALGGGLCSAALAFAFHWRGQRAEDAALAAAYRSLAEYAVAIARGKSSLPDGTAFDTVAATLAVPGPHRTRHLAYRDRALANHAEQLRIALAALSTARDHLATIPTDLPGRRPIDAIDTFVAAAGSLLATIADSCALTREPGPLGPLGYQLLLADRQLRGYGAAGGPAIGELFKKVRYHLRQARHLLSKDRSDGQEQVSSSGRSPDRRRTSARSLAHRPSSFDEDWLAIRANLTLESTACRHALRLAVTVTVATVLYRVIDTHDGYWIVVAVLFIMKPDFGSTVGRGLLRMSGTLVGVTLATLFLATLRPGPVVLAVLTVATSAFAYALFNANYGAFTVFLTCLTVFLAALIGLPPLTAVTNRALDNIIASLLAIAAIVLWPTWVATEVPALVATCLRAEHRFCDTVLGAFVRPVEGSDGPASARTPSPAMVPVDGPVSEETVVDGLIRAARLARSNAEAAVERMGSETPGVHKGSLPLDAAEGILAQMHRYGLSGLSLQVHMDHPGPIDMPSLVPARAAITVAMVALADAVEAGGTRPVPEVVKYSGPHARPTPGSPLEAVVAEEVDNMAEAVDVAVATFAQSLLPVSPGAPTGRRRRTT